MLLDEIRSRPDLFPVLRVLTDRKLLSTRFLVLSSASSHCCANPRSRLPTV